MKKAVFRPPDFWKAAVITLPDGSFFELLRSVFGNIKTPFNKQRLVADLAAFLSREEIQKTIYHYIDAADARIIAAVGLLDEPVQGELDSFFAGELSYMALHEILLNLEERFILYRFSEEGKNRLALNPVLQPVLAPIAADVSLLFPSLPPEGPAAGPGAVPDDRTLGGVLAFILAEPSFFKTEGGIRKKVLDAGALVFQGLDLEALAGGFRLLGLLRQEGEGFAPARGRLKAFAELSPQERMEYLAAGIYHHLYEKESADAAAAYLLRGRISSLAALIHSLVEHIKPERWYPPETLKRYGEILGRDLQSEKLREGVHFDKLFGLLETLGLLVSPAPGCWSAGPAPEAAEGEKGPALAMDSPFSCILYPGISFADILKLAAFFTIREVGVVVRFELTRESAVRGFDQGLSSDTMAELLKRLSQNRASESLIWSLKEWEKRYGEVCLRQGLILTLTEERRYLADAEPVAALIRETLAPGVYLLSGPGLEAAAEALRKAGVDIFSRSPGNSGESRGGFRAGGSEFSGAFSPLKRADPVSGPEAAGVVSGLAPGAESAALKERFRGLLEKMPLGREEREELASRIDRRLVLNDSQLTGASVRYEKLEARMLDYVGKAAIAKQAISSKSPVEVTWSHPQEGIVEVVGIPSALEKTAGESILVLNPLSPQKEGAARSSGDSKRIPGDSLRIPLGKISLLRRIKKSIFGE